MSMILALVLAPAHPAATPPRDKACDAHRLRPVQGKVAPGIHPLGHEPNAAAIRPVLRVENGCPTPVLVREDIGGQSARSRN